MIWALAMILLLAALPEVLTQLAGLFTSAFGCFLDDPCVVMGIDFGPPLYAMGLSFWFGMFTMPLAGLALIVWLIVLVVLLFKRSGAASAPPISDISQEIVRVTPRDRQ